MTIFLRFFLLTSLLFSTLISADTLDDVKKRGKLILATSGNMAPMTHKLSSGGATGFDIDLAELMATAMGVDLEIKIYPFEKLLDALRSGEADVVISNMTMTPERNMQVAFVGPYLTSGKCMITKESSLANADKTEAIRDAKPSIAILKGTTTEAFVKMMLPTLKPKLVASQDEGVELVRTGKVQAMMSEYPICAMVASANKEDGFIAEFSNLTYDPIGIAVRKDDAAMINFTQNFLVRITATGTIKLIGHKWLGDLAKIQ